MERMEQGLLTMASHLHQHYSAPLLRKQATEPIIDQELQSTDCRQTKYQTNLILCSNISKENLCPPLTHSTFLLPRVALHAI